MQHSTLVYMALLGKRISKHLGMVVTPPPERSTTDMCGPYGVIHNIMNGSTLTVTRPT